MLTTEQTLAEMVENAGAEAITAARTVLALCQRAERTRAEPGAGWEVDELLPYELAPHLAIISRETGSEEVATEVEAAAREEAARRQAHARTGPCQSPCDYCESQRQAIAHAG